MVILFFEYSVLLYTRDPVHEIHALGGGGCPSAQPAPSPIWDPSGDVRLPVGHPSHNSGLLAPNRLPACLPDCPLTTPLLAWSSLTALPCRPGHPQLPSLLAWSPLTALPAGPIPPNSPPLQARLPPTALPCQPSHPQLPSLVGHLVVAIL
uniref:Uncharacterized protein n=1 Tax=Myotis myotis TaxID=51298 RepID=A0A7J7SBX7_MYOMY|nr:hypothetical protein mMyoMyo1_009471 [Myotis myotis]